MRIIINVKTRNGKVEIVSKLDEGNKDTPNETKAGTWLFQYIDMVLAKIQKGGEINEKDICDIQDVEKTY